MHIVFKLYQSIKLLLSQFIDFNSLIKWKSHSHLIAFIRKSNTFGILTIYFLHYVNELFLFFPRTHLFQRIKFKVVIKWSYYNQILLYLIIHYFFKPFVIVDITLLFIYDSSLFLLTLFLLVLFLWLFNILLLNYFYLTFLFFFSILFLVWWNQYQNKNQNQNQNYQSK